MAAPGNLKLSVNLEGLPDLDTVLTGEISVYDPATGEMDVRPKTLGDLVAEKMVDRLIEDRDSWRSLRESVINIRDQIIREKVDPIIEEALISQIQLTNSYGEPKGKPVTLRELIVAEAAKELSRPTRGSHGSSETLLTKTIREQTGIALTRELGEATKEAKEHVVAAIRKAAEAFLVNETVKRTTK